MTISIPVYVINLARSGDRWLDIQASAEQNHITVQRIDAVEGKLLKADELGNFDEQGFRRWHGKIAMPAEIGCYFSHIRVLEAICAADDAYAVIVEDDVRFTPDFAPFVKDLTTLTGWDVVKLVNHRFSGFRRITQVNSKYSLGRSIHGPLGSSAAYIVTKAGAAKLLKAIKPMRVPYDVALERGWAGGFELFITDKPVVALSDVAVSTIANSREAYAKKRLPFWRRISTLFFRATDYVRRIAYALSRNTLDRTGR